MIRPVSLAIATIAFSIATSSAQAGTFDGFTFGQGPVASTGGSVNSGFGASPSFSPYLRSVNSFLSTTGPLAQVTTEVDASGSGTFRSDMFDLVDGDRGEGQLIYQVPGGVAPVDLTAMGDRFVAESVEATSQFQFIISLGALQFADTLVGPTSGPQDVVLPFSDFSSSPDFAANTIVSVFVRKTTAGDATFTMDRLSIIGPAAVIPLPATGLMLIGALGGLAAVGAARRRSS